MWGIRNWDNLKLYEREYGPLKYVEHGVRKIVNRKQRAFCSALQPQQLSELSEERNSEIIVSLTTFPERIDYVDMAIKSLLHQSIRPEKIVLWLSKEQFDSIKLPRKLEQLCEYGLEICYCADDLMAHKKYYYAMQKFPDKAIVTYDDDLIYPEDSIEKLLLQYQKYPDAIICNRGREILVVEGKVAPYDSWNVDGRILAGTPSYRIMPSTGAGTLYPPSCMPTETFDKEKIVRYALTADDLWMKAMSIYGKVPVVRTQNKNKALCLSVPKQTFALAAKNVGQRLNDKVMTDLLDIYPIVRKRLIEDECK